MAKAFELSKPANPDPVLHFIASGAKGKVRVVEILVTDATNGSVASAARSGVPNSEYILPLLLGF